MRRALTPAFATLLVLAFASPVSAAPPTREAQGSFVNDFAAGDVCDFAVRTESVVTNATTTTFDRRDGAFRQNLSGRLVERVTNLDTGASVIRNSSGPAKVFVNDASHVVLTYGGASVLPFFDGDVTGRGLLYFKGGGALTEIGDDGFFFVLVVFPPHVEDLCATLAA
jgi:hypothetical protein